MNLPPYEPSKHKDLRAQRAYDASGVHHDMMYCEFKGCSIMVYGKMTKPPIGASRFPGWETMARPARFNLTMDSKGKGKGKGGSAPPKSKGGSAKPKGKGKSKGAGKGKRSDRDETQSREDKASQGQTQRDPIWYQKRGRIKNMMTFRLYRMPVHRTTMWQRMCKELLTFPLSEFHGLPQWVSCKEHHRSLPIGSETTNCGRLQTKTLSFGNHASRIKAIAPLHQGTMTVVGCVRIRMLKN